MRIERGIETARPVKAVVYGPEGVGKTTFAAQWPGAVILDIEGGSSRYDVARIKASGWEDIVNAARWAAREPEIGTLVVDTADAAEAACIASVCKTHKKQGIEDFGYGKGYMYVAERFGQLMNALDACIDAGKNVLVVAHSTIRKFEQPDELGAYDRWEMKLSKKVAPIVKEWADLILFANYRTDVMRDENGKAKATGGRTRVMHAEHTASFDAKNRFGLPPEMPMDFAQIAHVIPSGTPAPAPTPSEPTQPWVASPLMEQLSELMARSGVTDGELRAAVASRPNGYTATTPVTSYDEAFVRDVLVACWPQVFLTVEEMRKGTVEVIDVPFDN